MSEKKSKEIDILSSDVVENYKSAAEIVNGEHSFEDLLVLPKVKPSPLYNYYKDSNVPSSDLNFIYFIPLKYSGHVGDQESSSTSLAFAFADVVTMVYRIKEPKYKNLVLSPQALIDSRCTSVECAAYVLTEPFMGLQRIGDYPCTLMAECSDKWELKDSENELCRLRCNGKLRYRFPGARFLVDGFVFETWWGDKIKEMIVDNFSTSGSRFPIYVVVCLDNKDCKPISPGIVSRLSEEDQKIFIHHAMVVIGVDTRSSEDTDHVAICKNSRGKSWGCKGFDRMDFKLFYCAALPILHETRVKTGKPKSYETSSGRPWHQIMPSYSTKDLQM